MPRRRALTQAQLTNFLALPTAEPDLVRHWTLAAVKSTVIQNGCGDTQPYRRRCRCKACASRFDDLTGMVLAGHRRFLAGAVGCAAWLCLLCA